MLEVKCDCTSRSGCQRSLHDETQKESSTAPCVCTSDGLHVDSWTCRGPDKISSSSSSPRSANLIRLPPASIVAT